MSYFGTGSPKFKIDAQTYILNYVVYEAEELDDRYIEHQSVITLDKEFDDLGVHYKVVLKMHLWKYENPMETYNTLLSIRREFGEFWRRGDGESFKDKNNNPVMFRFDSMIPDIPELLQNEKDILHLTFISQDPIIFSSSLKQEEV